jgi:hypothetical protein
VIVASSLLAFAGAMLLLWSGYELGRRTPLVQAWLEAQS